MRPHSLCARTRLWSAVCYATLAIVLCGCEPSPESYYPLSSGSKWKYVMSGEVSLFAGWTLHPEGWKKAQASQSLDNYAVDMESQPSRQIDGKEVTPFLVGSQFHHDFWFFFVGKDALGFVEVARQKKGATEPEVHKEPQYQLRFPLRVGTSWDTVEPVEFLDEKLVLNGTAKITHVDDMVTVPAGTFRKCIRVESSTAGSKEIKGMYQTLYIEREITQWFAPKVGLIKQIEKDQITPEALGSGERTIELVGFKVQ